jgi:hypothetical protein
VPSLHACRSTLEDPPAYANLLRTVYPAIKAADPGAVVLAAGIVSPEPAGSFLQAIADNGAWNSFDVIALHPYTDPLGPEAGSIDTVGIGAIQTLAARLGPKPIWVTEFGWADSPSDRTGERAVDVETQANYLIRAMALLRQGYRARIRNHGHSCFLCEIVIRSQFHTTYEPEA